MHTAYILQPYKVPPPSSSEKNSKALTPRLQWILQFKNSTIVHHVHNNISLTLSSTTLVDSNTLYYVAILALPNGHKPLIQET